MKHLILSICFLFLISPLNNDKARTLATRINEPNDPRIVSSFISLIKIYGEEADTQAVNTATSLRFGKGKWEMRYIVGILQNNYTPLEKP